MATIPLPTFLPCLKFGLQASQHDLITYFSWELAAMSHVSFPKKGDLGLSQGLIGSGIRNVYTNWLSPGASGAGAPPMPLTITMYLSSGVETPRN